MSRVLVVNLKKILTEKNFWLCSLIAFCLCFTASAGTNDRTGDPLNIWHYFIEGEQALLMSDIKYSTYSLAEMKGGGWFSMFLPMLSALTFVNMLCDGKNSHYIRYEMYRSGYFRLKISQFVSAFLSGGLCCIIGYGISILVMLVKFPHLSDYSIEIQKMFYMNHAFSDVVEIALQKIGVSALYFLLIAEMFLYGAFSVLPALVTSSITNNKYLIVCIPFMFTYCFSQLSARLSGVAYSDYMNPNTSLGKLADLINPNAVSTILTSETELLPILFVNMLLLLITFVAFVFFRKDGVDKSE